MPVYKSDGVDNVNHLPKKFVRLNVQVAASTSTTFTKGEVMMIDTGVTTNGGGQNVTKASGDDLARAIGICAETKTIDNSGGSAVMNDTILVQVAGHNDECTGAAAIAVGELCGHDGVNPALAVGDGTTGVTTFPFAICVVAATTAPTVNFTDLEILIYDHGFYG
tara:strand:- start:5 stop:499 length:495 start_codon:yes stop_codon:yes gene_type:complete